MIIIIIIMIMIIIIMIMIIVIRSALSLISQYQLTRISR